DWSVTGVQTCALPIWARSYTDIGAGTGAFAAELQTRHKRVVAYERSRWGRLFAHSQGVDVRGLRLEELSLSSLARVDVALCFERSEERRVGEEGRCGW